MVRYKSRIGSGTAATVRRKTTKKLIKKVEKKVPSLVARDTPRAVPAPTESIQTSIIPEVAEKIDVGGQIVIPDVGGEKGAGIGTGGC